MKNRKKIPLLAVTGLLAGLLALSACAGPTPTASSGAGKATPAPGATQTDKKSFIKAGDTYRYIRSDFKTDSQYLEYDGALGDHIRTKHAEMEEAYGINIEFVVCEADWSGYMLRSAYAGNPVADVGNAGGPFALMTFYKHYGIPESAIQSLTTLSEAATFSNPDYWQLDLQETMGSFNGELYFANPGYIGWELPSLSQVTFFNKRIVEGAGYTPATLYQWQKDNDWTWARYREILVATTDADMGIWGSLAGQVGGILYALVPSNDGAIVEKREVNGQQLDILTAVEPKALAAYDYFAQLAGEGLIDTSLNTTEEAASFATGRYATMVTYLNRTELLTEMEDDFGILLPPKGPDAETYVSDVNWNTPLCIFQSVPNALGTAQFLEEFFAPRFATSSIESQLLLEVDLEGRVRDKESVETCKLIPQYSRASSFALYAQVAGFSEKVFYDPMALLPTGETTAANYFASIESAVNTSLTDYQQAKEKK